MNNFEKLLYSKINQDSVFTRVNQDNDLFSFWVFLKKQMSERLSTVSAIFPHYSLHDSSHSEKILDIIWKIYGEESLKKLSVSNIFMILVSVYSHDLGMTVTSEDLFTELKSDEFINLVKKISEDKEDPCYTYANCFEVKHEKLYYKSDLELTADTYNASRYLLSVYFRKRHAERSKKDVRDTLSQYNSYLKNSVISQIGNICLAHNQSFDDVLKIPKDENGIYGDSWNPLFIACSLRLGDLLDLESDRFSKSYWESLPTRPLDSEFHKQKHEAIKHFVVNQDIIEATAECETYDVYKLLVDEFEMIKTEVADQMSHWKFIAPNTGFSSLPCIGEFSVSLKGSDTFSDGKIPAFHINQEKAFELIKGAGIYADKFSAIREILQNAVDAIIIRCFLENEKNKENLEFENFNKILSKYKIVFSIRKNDSKSDSKNICWNIVIEDCGIGMDKEDLRFLLDAASSAQNPFKKEIVSRMPEWTRPSGVFGLGFQSIFQLSETIEVLTRKINSAFEYELKLNSPSKNIKSSVRLKKGKADFSRISGTTVSFDFQTPVIPENISVSIDEPLPNASIENFDFVLHQSLDYEIYRILSAAQKFASTSVIPVEFHVEKDEPFVISTKKIDRIHDAKFYYEYGIELLVPKNYNALKYHFRNVIISKMESHIRFIPFSANIFSGNAKEILKYNREEFQNNPTVAKILQNTIYAGRKYIIENFNELPEDMKYLASMYVRYYDGDSDSGIENSKLFGVWEEYYSPYDNNNITFKEIVDFTGIVKLQVLHGGTYRNSFIVQREDDEMIIKTQFNIPDEIHFLIKELLKAGKRIQLSEYIDYVVTYEFAIPDNEIEKYDFIKNYESLFANVINVTVFLRRFTIPCNAKYSKLAIEFGKDFIPYAEVMRPIHQDLPKGYDIPVMISPYVINRGKLVWRELKLENEENVIEFTYNNRRDKTVTKEEIGNLYHEFIRETHDIVKKLNNNINTMNILI